MHDHSDADPDACLGKIDFLLFLIAGSETPSISFLLSGHVFFSKIPDSHALKSLHLLGFEGNFDLYGGVGRNPEIFSTRKITRSKL